ncbi:MAG: hypothetical protein RL490_281, partial [Pseudomonadota bacterium]
MTAATFAAFDTTAARRYVARDPASTR